MNAAELERFEARYVPVPYCGCWLWDGNVLLSGYGVLGLDGPKPYHRRVRRAHRLSYEHYVGPIPPGLHVLHSCDVRCCVNPDHLRLGTNADNIADKVARNRQQKGEGVPSAKFTAATIREIRRARAGGATLSQIMARFGTSLANASQIVNRKTWKHVE